METINTPQLMSDEQAARMGFFRPSGRDDQTDEMTLNEYQRQAATFATEESKCFAYMLAGLGEETGELQGKFAKAVRKGLMNKDYTLGYHNTMKDNVELRKAIKKEMGDVLWMLSQTAALMGITLETVARENIAKLTDRQQRGVIVGEGDNR